VLSLLENDSGLYAHQVKPAYARRGEKQGQTPSETGACSNGGYGRGQLSFSREYVAVVQPTILLSL